MILISEDGKSLVIINDWNDVVERPGYKSKIDPKETKPKQILGRYHIAPKQPCGISSCGTAHNMGYLVLCENGTETNIGNKCGKRIFGVDFQALEKTFTRDTNAQRYRENISKFQNQIANFNDRVNFLIDGEQQGQWCYDRMHWHITKGFESKTLEALKGRSLRNDPAIYNEVGLSKEEREAARETGDNSGYKREFIANINGINAVRDYKKLKSLMRVVLTDEKNVFESLDPDVLDFKDLRRWNGWANRFEKKIKEADDIIIDCKRFLVPSNVQLIRDCKQML